jgi:hypothetical protein
MYCSAKRKGGFSDSIGSGRDVRGTMKYAGAVR